MIEIFVVPGKIGPCDAKSRKHPVGVGEGFAKDSTSF